MALKDYKKDMVRCARCSVCKFIPLSSIIKSWRFAYGCPAIARYHFHSYSAGGKLILALSLLEGRITPSPKLRDVVYACTLCGLCDHACKIGTDMEVLEILHEFRVHLVEKGEGPLEAHRPIIESIKNYGNVWMQPRARRERWAKDLDVKILDGKKVKADVLYYVGCTYSYDPELQRVAINTARIFQTAGVDFGILGRNEVCCVSPAYMVGVTSLFEEVGRANIELFNELGVETVVTSCAGCYSMFKSKYPRLGVKMNFEVKHTVQVFYELLQKGKLSPARWNGGQVTYHDPCHLGRLGERREPSHGREKYVLGTMPVKEIPKAMGAKGICDEPRALLDALGAEGKEMERRREYAWCCGAGGGVKTGVPDLASFASGERIQEAVSTGAGVLVTACPWCEKNLQDAVEQARAGLRILDITDVITGGEV